MTGEVIIPIHFNARRFRYVLRNSRNVDKAVKASVTLGRPFCRPCKKS